MAPVQKITLSAFWAQLPTPARWLLSSTVFQVLGRGMTLPFTLIYLHEVRDLSLDVAGFYMAFIGMVALVFTPSVGHLTDRWGARIMVILGSLAQGVGVLLLAFADDVSSITVAIFFIGLANAGGWSSANVLVASMVSGVVRQTYFSINFALVNLGIGVGGVVGGLVVDVSRPDTFTQVYLVNAACTLVPVAMMLGPLRKVSGKAEPTPEESRVKVSYLAILRRPGVVQMFLIGLIFSFVGYGQMEAGFPAWSRDVSRVSTEVIGLAFALNALFIICFQFLALRLIQGHRRTRVIMVMAAIWAVSWLALASTGGPVAGTGFASAMVITYCVLFAAGETLLQPTLPTITNDMAPAHLRGRYNALSAGSFQLGAVVAPLSAGFLLRHDLHITYVATLLLGCAAMAWAALSLERRVSPAVNGLPDPVPEVRVAA